MADESGIDNSNALFEPKIMANPKIQDPPKEYLTHSQSKLSNLNYRVRSGKGSRLVAQRCSSGGGTHPARGVFATHQLTKAGTIKTKNGLTSIKSPCQDDAMDGERSPNTCRSSLNNSGFGTYYANGTGRKIHTVTG